MPKYRLNLSLDYKIKDKLDELQERTGVVSTTESIRRAIGLYMWYLDEINDGKTIIVRDKNGNDQELKFLQ